MATPLCGATTATKPTCKVKPQSAFPSANSNGATGSASTPQSGLDANPDPNRAVSNFQNGQQATTNSAQFATTTMQPLTVTKSKSKSVKWLAIFSAVYFSIVIAGVIALWCYPTGELITPVHAQKIAIGTDIFFILLGFTLMVVASHAKNTGGITEDFIGSTGLALLITFSVLLMPYAAAEIHVVRHFHEDIKSLKWLILFQGLAFIFCIGAVAVLLTWISAVEDLPEQVRKGSGGSRWHNHPLASAMGGIEHAACESYRTCCRSPNLRPWGAAASAAETRSDTCSSLPQPIAATARVDQGMLTFQDASQPQFCDAISGSSKYKTKGITYDACRALDKDMSFGQSLCQAEFCIGEAIPAYHAFLTRVVEGVRKKYLTPGLVLLNILIGLQFLRMFVFRELIQNATHERAAIELHDVKDAVHVVEHDAVVAAKAVEHALESVEHKLEDTLHIHRHKSKTNLAKG